MRHAVGRAGPCFLWRTNMWNGYDARLVDSDGAHKNGIENVKDKMVRAWRCFWMWPGSKAWTRLRTATASAPRSSKDAQPRKAMEIRKGDFVVVRTGHMERCLTAGNWEGYAGGNAARGLRFETAGSGFGRRTSPRSARIPGAARSGQMKREAPRHNPGTGWSYP